MPRRDVARQSGMTTWSILQRIGVVSSNVDQGRALNNVVSARQQQLTQANQQDRDGEEEVEQKDKDAPSKQQKEAFRVGAIPYWTCWSIVIFHHLQHFLNHFHSSTHRPFIHSFIHSSTLCINNLVPTAGSGGGPQQQHHLRGSSGLSLGSFSSSARQGCRQDRQQSAHVPSLASVGGCRWRR